MSSSELSAVRTTGTELSILERNAKHGWIGFPIDYKCFVCRFSYLSVYVSTLNGPYYFKSAVFSKILNAFIMDIY